MLARKTTPLGNRAKYSVSPRLIEKPVEGEYDRLKRISDDVSRGNVISTKGMSRAEFIQFITNK